MAEPTDYPALFAPAEDDFSATAWLNAELAAHPAGVGFERHVTSIVMKLKHISDDLGDDIEANAARILAAAPQAVQRVDGVARASQTLQDRLDAVRGALDRADGGAGAAATTTAAAATAAAAAGASSRSLRATTNRGGGVILQQKLSLLWRICK